MNFQPLTAERLVATQKVAAELFPWEHEHETALAAVVSPIERDRFCATHRLASVRSWTVHQGDGPVCGLATLYGYAAQPNEVWLAWFGLVESARGRGAGARLLDWLINSAKAEGRHALRLWTTDESEYARATELYLRRGFVPEEYPSLPGEDWKTRVFSLGLEHHAAIPWSAVLDRGELCGRAAPALAAAAA